MRSETYKKQKQIEISKETPEGYQREDHPRSWHMGLQRSPKATKLHEIEEQPKRTHAHISKNKQTMRSQNKARNNKNPQMGKWHRKCENGGVSVWDGKNQDNNVGSWRGKKKIINKNKNWRKTKPNWKWKCKKAMQCNSMAMIPNEQPTESPNKQTNRIMVTRWWWWEYGMGG